MRGLRRRAALAVAAVSAALLTLGSGATAGAVAQDTGARAAIEALEFEPLEFVQPRPGRYEVEGVRVLLLEDHALPLVTFSAQFRGGYGRFGRETYAAAMGLPAMLRYGGTATLDPDSVDVLLEHYAVQVSFGTGGGSISSSMNTLTEHLGPATELWRQMLAEPGFDDDEIEVWRGRELERVLRRGDNPSGLAFSEFNRLLYGDHPIGWEMQAADLVPERVGPDRFRDTHDRIVCRDNLILGISGDLSWDLARPLVERLVGSLDPCPAPLPESPIPQIRREPGVFLIERELEQSVVVMAHPTTVRLSDGEDYFAATMGNSILGGGGFSSRLISRVRTEEGYAYAASSLWTTPRRYDGLLGAITQTRPENTLAAIRVILETMSELRDEAPSERELRTAVDRVVNGFVFNFQTAGQIVSRMMFYLADGLPDDWLERYANGVQAVRPGQIRDVFAGHLRPEAMTILVVGDPDRIGREGLAELGPVTVLEVD